MKNFLVAIMLCAGVGAVYAQPSERQCARQMCDQIRQCTTMVEYPNSQVPEKVEKPKGPVKPNTDVQGRESNSCRQDAFYDYLACALGGGNKVMPPTKKSSSTTAR